MTWAPRLRRRLWRIAHNVLAHPLLEVLPDAWGTRLHDWTGARAFDALASSSE